jgi:hypothetical protein
MRISSLSWWIGVSVCVHAVVESFIGIHMQVLSAVFEHFFLSACVVLRSRPILASHRELFLSSPSNFVHML